MKRVLVTGADGQLGQCLRKISGDFPDFEFAFHNSKTLNISNNDEITAVFTKGNYDFCINCAAYTNVEQAEKTPEPAFKINAEALKLLAESCLKHDVKLIHISTDYVFDGTKKTGYFPNDETNPINEYGKSKLKGEIYIQEILDEYFIVRTSWLYSEFGNNFYKTIIRKANAKEDLKITDEQIGCPTNANNLASYILNLIKDEATNFGIHHFTDGEAMSWYGFAKQILKENELNTTIEAKNFNSIVKRPEHVVLKSLS